ncbi:MAG: gliding motility-associated C-terminal domain-containing protein, partial [Flavobacteriales bacterium]|nr:gliding motility-associated C-terminal domain-containing protein [Flavobacteriales bacterium]
PSVDMNFMTVGVFGGDEGKTVEAREGNPEFAYYFFDEFRVMEVDNDFDITQAYYVQTEKDPKSDLTTIEAVNQTDFFIPNAFSPNGDGDNDLFRPISSIYDHYQFEIFSRWGELLFSSKSVEEGWDGKVSGLRAESGVYVWRITYQDTESEARPSEKHIQGTVNLLR